MRKYLHITLAALCLAVIPATVVHAQDFYGNAQSNTGFNFDIHPYAGIGFGAFGLEEKEPGFSQKRTVFGGFGKFGVDIGNYLGAELRVGATSTGTQSNPAGTFGGTIPFDSKLSSDYFISYLAKIQSWESAGFRIYGLVGATTAKVKVAVATGLGSASSKHTKTGVSYGFGINYHVQDSLTVGGECGLPLLISQTVWRIKKGRRYNLLPFRWQV